MSSPIEILLVEDNPDDVALTLDALKENNVANRVHVVRDGEEALAFMFGPDDAEDFQRIPPPRVILLDLKLPKIDGMGVLRRLKSDPRTRSIPVVMMTTSKEERDIVASYELGVNSYIVKPVDFDQFLETVRHLGLYWLLLNEDPSRVNQG